MYGADGGGNKLVGLAVWRYASSLKAASIFSVKSGGGSSSVGEEGGGALVQA